MIAHQRAKEFSKFLQRRFRAPRLGTISESTALRLLNRKCGRMRAVSACRRPR